VANQRGRADTGGRRAPTVTEDDEVVQAFLDESRDNLDQLDRDLVDLESRPSDPALLAQIFRTIHTIKGTCGFLGFSRLEALTHAGENLLGALRAGELPLDGTVTTSLLALVDSIRAVLRTVEATGVEGDADHEAVILDLARHLAPEERAAPAPPAPRASAQPDEAHDVPLPSAESSVRVDVAVLDKLLDLVGELVLTRSQIGDVAQGDEDGALALPYRQLRLVTRELQDGVMQARLQPIGSVTGKFHRIARDLATGLGKKVRVELEGEEVGVDKAVNEALRDPLLHLVRNAVDHGLEPPPTRLAAGKPAEGLLRIKACHDAGRVQVVVSDDGGGIDGDGLVERALAAGDLTADEAAEMTPGERLELIFRPGLSTKQGVTSLSGRGVGMDVVRANLEQVGGSVEVSSEIGKGTVFLINVPLTLAILPALVVRCGGERYAIPQVDVQEILQLDGEDGKTSVDDIAGARLHRLRGQLLPLVELAQHLRVSPARRDDRLDVVVVRDGGRRFGLVVDGVGDTIEAVVKPLTRAVRSVPVFAGVTILGDGRPSLILDVAGLASGAAVEALTDDQDGGVESTALSSSSGLLIATGANGIGLAFRLDTVRRLEQLRADRVERTGGTDVVQYGDTILPLIWVGGALSDLPLATDSPPALLDAVVCASSAGLVALVVDRIEDVVAEPPAPTAVLPGHDAALTDATAQSIAFLRIPRAVLFVAYSPSRMSPSAAVSVTNPKYEMTALLSHYPPLGNSVGDLAMTEASFVGAGGVAMTRSIV